MHTKCQCDAYIDYIVRRSHRASWSAHMHDIPRICHTAIRIKYYPSPIYLLLLLLFHPLLLLFMPWFFGAGFFISLLPLSFSPTVILKWIKTTLYIIKNNNKQNNGERKENKARAIRAESRSVDDFLFYLQFIEFSTSDLAIHERAT